MSRQPLVFKVVPHREAVIAAVAVFSIGTLLSATCAAVFTDGVAGFSAAVALFFGFMTVDVSTQLRPDTFRLADTGIGILQIDRRAFLRKRPSLWFAKREIELRWDDVLHFSRSRWMLDGPAIVLHLSENGARRAGVSQLTLPAVDTIPIEELEADLNARWRRALLKLGVGLDRT